MKEILWLGRGGQGAFTAAKLFGAAYIQGHEKQYALAFPSFGPERRGAPVRAFTKLDESPVLDRSQTVQADYIVVLDDTLYAPELQSQLKADGRIIVNSKAPIPDTFSFSLFNTKQNLFFAYLFPIVEKTKHILRTSQHFSTRIMQKHANRSKL